MNLTSIENGGGYSPPVALHYWIEIRPNLDPIDPVARAIRPSGVVHSAPRWTG